MKKIILFLLIVIFVFSPSILGEEINVTLESVRMVYNNHVGNEWFYGASVNEQSISKNKTLSFSVNDQESIVIKCTVQEQDKVSDYGNASKTIKPSEITEEKVIVLTPIVRENRGRYSGNTAKWEFKFRIK